MNRRLLLKRTAIIVGIAFNTLMITYLNAVKPPTTQIFYEGISSPDITYDTDTMHTDDIRLVAL